MKKASPFPDRPEGDWLASNALAFAIFDAYPVTPGHTLVITRRLVPTFFDATPTEQAAMIETQLFAALRERAQVRVRVLRSKG